MKFLKYLLTCDRPRIELKQSERELADTDEGVGARQIFYGHPHMRAPNMHRRLSTHYA